MAARVLRHFVKIGTTAQEGIGPVVPAGRAYVGKITVTSINSTPGWVTIYAGGQPIADQVQVARGEMFEITGVVAHAGEQFTQAVESASRFLIHFFGEEVDN